MDLVICDWYHFDQAHMYKTKFFLQSGCCLLVTFLITSFTFSNSILRSDIKRAAGEAKTVGFDDLDLDGKVLIYTPGSYPALRTLFISTAVVQGTHRPVFSHEKSHDLLLHLDIPPPRA